LKAENLKEVSDWIDYLEKEFLESRKFWKWENLIKKGKFGKGMDSRIYGFTRSIFFRCYEGNEVSGF